MSGKWYSLNTPNRGLCKAGTSFEQRLQSSQSRTLRRRNWLIRERLQSSQSRTFRRRNWLIREVHSCSSSTRMRCLNNKSCKRHCNANKFRQLASSSRRNKKCSYWVEVNSFGNLSNRLDNLRSFSSENSELDSLRDIDCLKKSWTRACILCNWKR